MEKRRFTISVPNVGKADFNRLSTSLKRHLARAFPEEQPTLSTAAQPKATLQLTVKAKHAKAALMRIAEWRLQNPTVELFIDGKLHKTTQGKTRTKSLKLAKPSIIPKQISDGDFVLETRVGGLPGRIPDDDFVLEEKADVPSSEEE